MTGKTRPVEKSDKLFPSPGLPKSEECTYTSCYCEENVWKLCYGIREDVPLLSNSYAVFVSNDRRFVPLWCQKSGKTAENGLVLWDYHVFLLSVGDAGPQVYDLDTTLDFPVPFLEYVGKALLDETNIKPDFHRKFRVVRGDEYLKRFASDRSHMRREDGSWLKQPPAYDPIRCQDSDHNLEDFISMDPSRGFGRVMTYDQFVSHFSPTAGNSD